MPRIDFNNALQEFESSLSQVESNLVFIESAQWLRPRLGKIINWNTLDPESKSRCQAFMRLTDVQVEISYRSLLISVTGSFEQFIRRLVRDAVLQINQSAPRFEDINAALILQNRLRTGDALSTIAEPPDHMELDYEALCTNLGTCVIGREPVVLNFEAFSYFVTTLTPTKLEQILKRIGFVLDWDDVGRDRSMQEILGTTGVRQSATAAVVKLKSVIKDRNLIAHTSNSGKIFEFRDVMSTKSFLGRLGLVLSNLVAAKLNSAG